MKNLKELVESYTPKTYTKVKRNERSYRETYVFIGAEIERYYGMYQNAIEGEQSARLIRDMLDVLIRRYHDYAIRGDIGAHYRQTGIVQGDTIFEHVIPAKEILGMLIEGKLTVKQALNAPTCFINKADDVKLRQTGLGASSPNRWQFFKRYQGLNSNFTTYNGQKIELDSWTLEDHYRFFNVEEE
jgi:hypothetical protein